MQRISYKFIGKILGVIVLITLTIALLSFLQEFLNSASTPVKAIGSTYYVSTTGDDATGDGTSGSPWATIDRGIDSMDASDTLKIAAGTYNEFLIIPPRISGTDTDRTVIEPWNSGDSVKIAYATDTKDVVTINASYLTFQDIEVDGTAAGAVPADAKKQCLRIKSAASAPYNLVGVIASNVVVHGCRSHGVQIVGEHDGAGNTFTSSAIVENSTIYDTNMQNENLGDASGWGSALKVGRDGTNIILRNNVVYDNWGEGIAVTRGTNVDVYDNLVYNNLGINMYIDNSINVSFERNFSYCLDLTDPNAILKDTTDDSIINGDRLASGIALAEEDYNSYDDDDGVARWNNQFSGARVVNNISYNCYRSLAVSGAENTALDGGKADTLIAHNTFYTDENTTSSSIRFAREVNDDIIFKNNIVKGNSSQGVLYQSGTDGTAVFDYNLWVDNSPTQSISEGPNDVTSTEANVEFLTTPGFSADTFKIGNSSFAKDVGSDLSVSNGISDDYFGTAREALVDIGAHEYAGTTYYVDFASGSDSNSGTSTTTPWQNSSKISSGSYGPGDSILFKRGQTHSSLFQIVVNGSGTSTKPILIGAYDSGSLPILENANTADNLTSGIISIENDWVELSDLKFDDNTSGNITETGVRVKGDNIKVHDIEATSVGHAIAISGSTTEIYNNNIHDLVMVVNDATPDNDYGSVGVFMQRGSVGAEVYNNTFTDLKPVSIDYGYDGSALEVFGSSSGVNFYYNTVINVEALTEFGSDISTDTAQNYTIHHNIIKNTRGTLVFHNDSAGGGFGMNITNIRIENNTFYRDDVDVVGFFIGFDTAPAVDTFYLQNNIIALSNLTNFSLNAGSLNHEYNLYELSSVNGQTYTLSGSELNGNVEFVDPGTNNFRITSASSARDNGTNLGYTSDYDGNSLPDNVIYDIGAFEFISTPVSISFATDGVVSFGTQPLGSTVDTTASGIDDTESITVDQGPVDLLVKSTDFSDGSGTWALEGASGGDSLSLEFAPDGSTWSTFSSAGVNQTLVTSVTQSQTQSLDLRLTMPTSISSFGVFTGTITVTAVSP